MCICLLLLLFLGLEFFAPNLILNYWDYQWLLNISKIAQQFYDKSLSIFEVHITSPSRIMWKYWKLRIVWFGLFLIIPLISKFKFVTDTWQIFITGHLTFVIDIKSFLFLFRLSDTLQTSKLLTKMINEMRTKSDLYVTIFELVTPCDIVI